MQQWKESQGEAMAKAKLNREETLVVEESVTLKLSMREARTLVSTLGAIGGSPRHSPRKYTDAVLDALTELHFYNLGLPTYNDARAIYYSNEGLALVEDDSR